MLSKALWASSCHHSLYIESTIKGLVSHSDCFLVLYAGGAGSRDGAVVRALASHQCAPGSIPRPGVICGLSLLLVLYCAPRGFSLGSPVLPSP